MSFVDADTIKKELLSDPVPPVIFKYSPINDNLIESLANSYLWYSSPHNLNDPYDCFHHSLTFEPSPEDIEELMTANSKEKEDELKKLIQYYSNNPSLIGNAYYQHIEGLVGELGICCFTDSYANSLMWAHYAGDHKGVCLGFEPYKDVSSFWIGKVMYVEDFTSENYFAKGRLAVLRMLYRKLKHWEYENEYRAWHFTWGKRPFDKAALTHVIFGCKTLKEDMLKVANTIKRAAYPSMRYAHAKIHPSSPNLKFDEIYFHE